MTETKRSILVVDDEPAQRQLLCGFLAKEYAVSAAADGLEAAQLLSQRNFDLVIADERMPRMGGMELIKWVRDRTPETPIILLLTHGSTETAVEALRQGADQHLAKPLKGPEELHLLAAKALQLRALRDRILVLQDEWEMQYPHELVARSKEMQRVLKLADQAAGLQTSVLLAGETGTGREAVARYIHRRSPRSAAPLAVVHCTAPSDTQLESDLFGHEPGAFSGAVQCRRGQLELAQGGTVYLDEVAEIKSGTQARLLRALQQRQFERAGGARAITPDVRFIAATRKDPQQVLESGTMRDDLFHLLNTVSIRIPPLRERREDILPLAEYFSQRAAKRMGRTFTGINVEAASILYEYGWPGNVRELANAVERALIVAGSNVIRPEDLPVRPEGETATLSHDASLAEMEKAAIVEALTRNGGDRRKTAGQLGISLRTLQYRLKDYGMIHRD